MLTVIATHEVEPGDTLSGIAHQYGVALADLQAVNPQITHPNLIQVGQKINIPRPAAAPPAPVGGGVGGVVYDGIHPAPGTVSIQRAQYVHPSLTNAVGARNANAYAQVINQFGVGNNPRYLPGGGNTYCNIFVWDVTRAMGAELPHWITGNGAIAAPGAAGASETTINGGVNWMLSYGVPHHGWHNCTAQEAQDAANQGQIAVVMWKNPAGHGHTAMVRPGTNNADGPATAQAGAHNFNMGHVKTGFGFLSSAAGSPLRYFWHA